MFRYIGHASTRLNIPPQRSVLVTLINNSELVGEREQRFLLTLSREKFYDTQNLHQTIAICFT